MTRCPRRFRLSDLVWLGIGAACAPAHGDDDVYARMRESVVFVQCDVEFRGDKLTAGHGSGFLVANSEYVVTNSHVINTCHDRNKASVLEGAFKEYYARMLEKRVLPAPIREELEANPRLLERVQNDPEVALRYLDEAMERLARASAKANVSGVTQHLQVIVTSRVRPAPMRIDAQVAWNSQFSDERAHASGVDVAILKLARRLADRRSVAFATASSARVADVVHAVGFPGASVDVVESNKYEPSTKRGIVSKLGGESPYLTEAAKAQGLKGAPIIETDAAISGGNSGGPLYNEYGEVLGITTFGHRTVGGVAWALDIAVVVPTMQDLGLPLPPITTRPRGWIDTNPTAVWGTAGATALLVAGGVVALRRRGAGATAGHRAGGSEALAGRRPGLVGCAGPFKAVSIPIPPGGLTLGRGPGGKGRLAFGESSDVSRRHCLIEYRDDTERFVVTDLGSSNGTFLMPHATRLESHRAVACARGQVVRVGAYNEFELSLLRHE